MLNVSSDWNKKVTFVLLSWNFSLAVAVCISRRNIMDVEEGIYFFQSYGFLITRPFVETSHWGIN